MSVVTASVVCFEGDWAEFPEAAIHRVVDQVFAIGALADDAVPRCLTGLAARLRRVTDLNPGTTDGMPQEGGGLELTIVLTDDATIRELNRRWRERDTPTNVLSFPLLGPTTPPPEPSQPVLLGDVVLARETITAEAAAQGKSFAAHFDHLLLHGLLHLLGFEHDTDDHAVEMEAAEVDLMARLGHPDPYNAGRSDDERSGGGSGGDGEEPGPGKKRIGEAS